jgi:NADH:ubiquinone oxidoreductase subunit E
MEPTQAVAADLGPALQIVEKMSPVTSGDIIPLLQRLQDAYGYLPREVVLDVCARTGLPASRVFGVATFYSQFYLTPRGRHLVRCCRGTACHVRGGKNVISTVEKVLRIRDGETSADMAFSFETVACLGACALSPVTVIDGRYHGKTTPRRIEQVLRTIREEQNVPEENTR